MVVQKWRNSKRGVVAMEKVGLDQKFPHNILVACKITQCYKTTPKIHIIFSDFLFSKCRQTFKILQKNYYCSLRWNYLPHESLLNWFSNTVYKCQGRHHLGQCIQVVCVQCTYTSPSYTFTPSVSNWTSKGSNMRFALKQAPLISLTFLPLVIAYNGHGIFGALFWMTLWLVASVASVIFRVKT